MNWKKADCITQCRFQLLESITNATLSHLFTEVSESEHLLYYINVKKIFSLEHSVRVLNHTSKTAQIILERSLDRTHWLPLHT